MKLALLSLLLAFAAPAPCFEAAAGIEEEVAVESSRSARSTSARSQHHRRIPQPPAPPALVPALDVSLSHREFAVWTPRLFSRPPPRG
jgi:hypothetical protein